MRRALSARCHRAPPPPPLISRSLQLVGSQPADATADGAGASRGGGAYTGSRRLRTGAASRQPRAGAELRSPLELSYVEDWEGLEALWTAGGAALGMSRGAHPILVAEPAYSLPAQREKMAELLFETLGAPAVYLARAPVLAAFSMGRSSAVVVDIGASATRTTPVHDGYVLTSEAPRARLAQ